MSSSFTDFSVVVEAGAPVTLRVSGEIDLLTAPQLRLELDAFDVGRGGDIVVDMTGVTFLDSSGLGVLFSAARRQHRKNARLILRGVSPLCLRAARMVGLDAVVENEG